MRSKLVALTVAVCGLLVVVLGQTVPGADRPAHHSGGTVTLADDNPIINAMAG